MQYADAIKVFEKLHLRHLRQFLSFEPIFESYGAIFQGPISHFMAASRMGRGFCDVMLSTERLGFHVLC